jgi:cytochrome c peroxidase
MATATVTRSFARALPRGNPSSTGRLASKSSRPNATKQFFESTSRRAYSSAPPPPKSRTSKVLGITAGAALFGTAVYYYTSQQGLTPEVHLKQGSGAQTPGLLKPTPADYQKVYDAIAKQLWEKDDYDDGSYGPVLLRLAWHASGTYDAETGTGGSNGATMRFAPEADHGANAGLKHARDFLEPIKAQFPWISYGDLWTLAGVCAIQEMQGPIIPWRPGRQDRDLAFCTPDGRLPDASKEQNHIRAIFGRMGFNDQEMVALSGAHALGRCHTDRSGFEGPWTFSPTVLTNEYFRLLMEEKWGWRSWNGPKQYEDATSKSLMMLPTDMALVKDKEFKKHVERYAKDGQVFFKEFSDVVCKLFELGVPFGEGSERLEFKAKVDQ